LGLIKRAWIWLLAILVVAGIFAAFRLGKKTDPDYFKAKVEKGDIRQCGAPLMPEDDAEVTNHAAAFGRRATGDTVRMARSVLLLVGSTLSFPKVKNFA